MEIIIKLLVALIRVLLPAMRPTATDGVMDYKRRAELNRRLAATWTPEAIAATNKPPTDGRAL